MATSKRQSNAQNWRRLDVANIRDAKVAAAWKARQEATTKLETVLKAHKDILALAPGDVGTGEGEFQPIFSYNFGGVSIGWVPAEEYGQTSGGGMLKL